MGAKLTAAGASGAGALPVPADAFVREDGVITAPPGGDGAVASVNGQTGTVVLTGASLASVVTLTDAATIAVNASLGSFFRVTLGGDRTLGTPSSPVDGQQITFEFIQGTGGGFTLAFSAAYAFPASIPQPTLSSTAGQRDFLSFIYDGGESLWQCVGWVPDQNAGVATIPQGGTGQVTQQAAINALAGAQTSGRFLRGNGTNVVMSAIQPGDLAPGTAFYGGIFGTAADGAVTLDGTTTYAGFASLAGSVYTLTRDVQAAGLTINSGVTLKPAGYRIFCQGTLTNNGTITVAGAAASGATPGGATGAASLGGGLAGGAGGTGVSGAGASGGGPVTFGVAGGAGGAGTSGGAGSGGTASLSNTIAQNVVLQTPYPVLSGLCSYNVTTRQLQWGAGGGGGGSDASSNAGGGGGSGGGIVAILAWAVINNGTITVAGGNGGTGVAGNAAGGGGGSGGLIVAYTLAAWTAGTLAVSGGNAGSKAGSGSGSNGNAGGTGLALNVVLA